MNLLHHARQNMPDLPPSIAGYLARLGIHLPQPYPHTCRTLLGSALAACLATLFLGFGYMIYAGMKVAGTVSIITADSLDQTGSAIRNRIYLLAEDVKIASDDLESIFDRISDAGDLVRGGVLRSALGVTSLSRHLESWMPDAASDWLVNVLVSSKEAREALHRQQQESLDRKKTPDLADAEDVSEDSSEESSDAQSTAILPKPKKITAISEAELQNLGSEILLALARPMPDPPHPGNVHLTDTALPEPEENSQTPMSLDELARRIPADCVLEVRESINPNALPYLENADAPLADIVRQVDFALLQTVLRLKMEDGRVFMLGTEYKKHNGTGCLFQRMRFFVPASARADTLNSFVSLLQNTLEVWSDRATCSRPARNKIVLAVDGMPTHEIWLESVGDEFLLPPDGNAPRMTVVIDDMGENLKALQELLALNIPVTVAVWPHSRYAAEVAENAFKSGREVLVHQPMEAISQTASPGLGAITLQTSPERAKAVLLENIRRVPHASGLNNHMGSRLTQNKDYVTLICKTAADSGLFLLDSVTHAQSMLYDEALQLGIPAYRRNIFLDDGQPSVKSVLDELHAAEKLAHKAGQSVAIGHPHPETLAALREWCSSRDMAIQIVPLRHLHVHRPVLKP